MNRHFSHQWMSLLSLACSGVILIWVLGSIVSPEVAHSEPSPAVSPSPLSGFSFGLPNFQGFLLTEPPDVNRGVVRLDGRELFAIATPQVKDAAQSNVVSDSLRLRVQTIEQRLQHIVNSRFKPDSLKVIASSNNSSGLPIIYARYRSGDKSYDDELMTVTTLDAQIHAATPSIWAEELTQTVETALLQAQQERQSAFLQQQGRWAIVIGSAMILSSVVVTYLQRRLQRERHQLNAQVQIDSQEQAELVEKEVLPGKSATPSITTALLQRQMTDRQRKGVNDIQRRVLQIAQLLIWGGGTFIILGLFPYSRWLQPILLSWLQIPLSFLAIAFVTYLLIRFGGVLVDRFLLIIQQSVTLAPDVSQRTALRFFTFSRVIKGILAFSLVGSAIMVGLSTIGLQVGPLLAGAGIIGLGISFASQSLIKDVLNGFFILLEDQYGVGDVITVGDVSGLVENMNLRITQLRNEEGRLITIPNSAITIVQNLSKEWSRVALQIDVAYNADVDRALMVIDEVAQEMSRDLHWGQLILEKPLLLGVDKLDYTGVTISLWIKTQPLKQWEVAREYRRRLKLEFDKVGIAIGVPQQSLWFGNSLDLDETPPQLDKDQK